MANYRYLGYGITDENGIATLDHDSNGDPITHSYTGTGAGEIDVVASLDDQSHISDSSILSETYETLDCIKYDNATQSSHNDSIWNSINPTGLDFIREQDYTSLTLQTGTSGATNYIIGLSNGVAIDFDIYQVDGTNGNGFCTIYSQNQSLTWFSLGNVQSEIGEWIPLRLILNETNATLTHRENTSKSSTKDYVANEPITRIRFAFNSNAINSIRLRNIRIYLI